MDLIDPSLVRLGEQLTENQLQRVNAQVDIVYDHTDAPERRTFVSEERHVNVYAHALGRSLGLESLKLNEHSK
jgi:hypothetical protein